MLKILSLITILAFSANAFQSGRRIATPTTPTPAAPIQPPLNPQPELPPTRPDLERSLLPDRIFERQIQSIRGTNFRLADFRGKVVVINLWASWCGPCRREVPEYEKVRKAYTNREVEFIGLTTEDPRAADKVDRFLSEVSFGFRLGWADRETATFLMNGRNSIPSTVVIDSTGRVLKQWSGYSAGQSGYRLKQAIEEALTVR
jgi:thiol-disulfide isomerase/thioredoxin